MTGIPGKTGIVYTLDRATGEFLWATPTVAQNVVSRIDGATGAVTENPEAVFRGFGQEVFTCPTAMGGKDWEAGAYSPRTNTMYMPLRNACARMAPLDDGGGRCTASACATSSPPAPTASARSGPSRPRPAPSRGSTSSAPHHVAGRDGRRPRVRGRRQRPVQGPRRRDREVLWEINLGSPVSGFPVTYAAGGRQYVIAGTGTGGNASRWSAMTPELRPSSGNNIFVFALP